VKLPTIRPTLCESKVGKMKKLVLLLALIFLTSAPAFTWARDGEPQFKTQITGSDSAGFDVLASYPDGKPTKCTVKVEVTFSATSPKAGKKEYEYNGTVHRTGSGWAWFGGESALDKSPLLGVKMTNKSCD
jgi:hypothetical protein